jgi:hypothetical protein
MRYKLWRSNKDKCLQLLCREGIDGCKGGAYLFELMENLGRGAAVQVCMRNEEIPSSLLE